jgi:two-component system NtrC family sensor kinase
MENLSQWKIVLIDDEEDIREVMTIALQDAGYDVDTAADGATGLQLCEDTSPQIVITDIRMPGIDGLQVLETIKKKYPDIEVIVATAFGEMNLAIRALQLDASDFITKPISDEALYLALRRARERFNSRKQLKDYTALLEKEKAETSQELLKNIAFQRNLIESSMDGILGCDDNDSVVTYNQSMEQMIGYPKEEVLHKMIFKQFFPAGELERFKEELSSNSYGGKKRLLLYETTLKAKSGREIPVQVSASLLFDQGRENGLVCFFRDLREMRKLEREVSDQARILHQDKMMSLGRLAASVVHEINNPLSGILNYIRLMSRILRQGSLSEDRKEKFQRYLDLVEKETKRCSQIVSGLLSFSRISPPSFGNVHIDELLQRCILLSQHKLELSNIRLESSIQPNLPPVEGDFNQLQQCMINLIFNALDAMPDGGKLTLNSRLDGNSGKVIITVRDTGRGIPSEHLPHIFEPFFTTKNEGYGVGLGLSTVYGIIERHKGTVHVESQPGEGTVIMLELPVSGSNKGG